MKCVNFFNDCPDNSVIILNNFHRNLGRDMAIIQTMANMVPHLKANLRTMIIAGPSIELPPELERLVTIIDHPLPGIESIRGEYERVAAEWNVEVNEEQLTRSVEVSTGLTMFEAENAISLSAVQKKAIDPDVIFNIKSQMIKRNGDLEIIDFRESLDDLYGMENLKEFATTVLPHPLSRGILILGVQGCGKSHASKGIGRKIGLRTVSMEFGDMFDSRVGASERKIKDGLRIIDAMQPLLLFIDEIGKDLAGASASGEHDTGVTKRVLKRFLIWMNDHTTRVPIIATANEIEHVPPEFLRAERWDAIFFVDIPTEEETYGILRGYLNQYDLSEDPEFVRNKLRIINYTGAEIKTLCRLASIFEGDLEKANTYVVPIYKMKKKEVDRLRDLAVRFAVPASGATIRTRSKPAVKKQGVRKVITKVITTPKEEVN